MLCIQYLLYRVQGSPSVSSIDQISESFVSTFLLSGNDLLVPPLLPIKDGDDVPVLIRVSRPKD